LDGAFVLLLVFDVGIGEDAAVVGRDILPVVEGIAVGGDGDGGLVLVHQELDEDIVGAPLAEEDELHVASHGDEPEDGEGVVQVLHIIGAVDGLLHTEDEGEGQHHTVVTKAQTHLTATRGNQLVGLVEEVLQQGIDGVVVGARAGHETLPQAPAGIIDTEAIDELVNGKQVVEREFELGQTVHVGGDVPQAVGQLIAIDEITHHRGVLEEQGHLVASVQFLVAELVQFLVERVVDALLRDVDAVVGRQVVHVVLAGIHRDVQLGIHALELLTEIGHREDAASDGRGVGPDIDGLHQQRRIVGGQTVGDALMLQGSQTGEVAIAVPGIGSSAPQPQQYLLTLVGEPAACLGGVQFADDVFVGVVVSHITGAMTAVVTHIEGFVALRGRRHMSRGKGIVAVIARGQFEVCQQFGLRGLGTDGAGHRPPHQDADNSQVDLFHK